MRALPSAGVIEAQSRAHSDSAVGELGATLEELAAVADEHEGAAHASPRLKASTSASMILQV